MVIIVKGGVTDSTGTTGAACFAGLPRTPYQGRYLFLTNSGGTKAEWSKDAGAHWGVFPAGANISLPFHQGVDLTKVYVRTFAAGTAVTVEGWAEEEGIVA